MSKDIIVQACDATNFHSTTSAKYIKKALTNERFNLFQRTYYASLAPSTSTVTLLFSTSTKPPEME